MTNGEKYGDEIRKLLNVEALGGDYDFCDEFVKPKILGKTSCCGLSCDRCILIQALWINEEYKEPGVDWSKVPVDTKVLVKRFDDEEWEPRYFAMYEHGKVYTFVDGKTSFSSDTIARDCWNYAKLAEVDDEKP